tara:strand:- start:5413 stop:5616 length:204 start_codon:yes stop_codon:yes gene_type:complete
MVDNRNDVLNECECEKLPFSKGGIVQIKNTGTINGFVQTYNIINGNNNTNNLRAQDEPVVLVSNNSN